MPICKILWAFSLTFFILSPLVSLDFPSMPSVSEPTMPTMDGKPYVGQPPYIPQTSNSQQSSQTETDTSDTSENTKTTSNTYTSTAENSDNSNLSNVLTAQTISGLGGLSSLADTLSALTSSQNASSYLPALSQLTGTTLSQTDSNATLESILKELQKLSQKETSQQNSSQKVVTTDTSDSSSSQTESQSKLLRFRVNNTDILDTCQTIYFSQPEENGLFLLTGDRSYYIDNKPYEETFYFLFTPALDDKGLFYYEVEGDIMQNAPITGSKLYPLTEKPSLIARKTGNLITLKYSAENWNLDILIDLREFH